MSAECFGCGYDLVDALPCFVCLLTSQRDTAQAEADRFRSALQDIAETDYRGNRPWSATRAHQALHPETGT